MIRAATLEDVPALADLEQECFETDRLSLRSFRHLLTRGNASLIVDEAEKGAIAGYSLVLFHRNTSMARLYSLAVLPRWRKGGIARALLEASEKIALEAGTVTMRLEVRRDNARAIAFYERAGYRQFSTYPDYYEDHVDAVRMEKALAPHLSAEDTPVPYYAQTLEFTCGPACLMMAMKAQEPGLVLDRAFELRLWRESTTIYMTSGHGGCGPFGLALSAWKRGFAVDLFVSEDEALFVDSVRSEEKKEVIRLVQADFLAEIAKTGIRVRHAPPTLAQLRRRFEKGWIPVVLVSAYRLTGYKAPHWMAITGFDDRFVYVHEPYVDVEEGETETVCFGIPIRLGEFDRMMRYGGSKQFAVVVVGPKRENA
ncbi:MAG: ribosomal-protein-alanine acetyltransferase [Rhodospirillales bacterium CG15_BIG_FIL_POST_REV_8_21_14_020_66_15]|nr:MAG: ribosomal-protein-alanine acetyltransferase [Rhodospirillales bacterium CG15_BIG_FIL_POST_REV_8_21_14_020_66_15]